MDVLGKLLGNFVSLIDLWLDLLRHVVNKRLVVLLAFQLLLFVEESLLLLLDLSVVLLLLVSHLLSDEFKLLLCSLKLFVLDLDVRVSLVALRHNLLEAFCHFDLFGLNSILFTLDLFLFFLPLPLEECFRLLHLLHHCCLLLLKSSIVFLLGILLCSVLLHLFTVLDFGECHVPVYSIRVFFYFFF